MPEQDMQVTLRHSLKQEGLYCLMTHSIQELIAPLTNLLHRDSFLIVQDTVRTFKKSFHHSEAGQVHLLLERNAETTYFFDDAKSAEKIRLKGLLKDIKRLPLGRKQQICVILDEHCFARSSEAELLRELSAWKRFCSENEHSVLFMIHGQYETLWPSLKGCNAVLMGLAAHNQNNDNTFSVDVDFWHLPDNLIADQEWLFHSDPHSFVVHDAEKVGKHNIEVLKSTTDSDTIFTLSDIYRDLYPRQHVVADKTSNLELVASLQENINAATVILRCRNTSEIDELAILVYQLRCRAGEKLKIVVRETDRCLRSADEVYLLNAGCNLIIPYNVKGARVRNMVSALQGMLFKRSLPPTLSKLSEMRPYSRFHGYCEPQDFVRYVQRAFGNTRYGEMTHLLIQLKPLEGISLEQTLGLCRLRREGDLLTIANDMVYLFLYACGIDDVDTALHNSLELPVNDIFSGRQVYHQPNTINSELKLIGKSEVAIDTERARDLLDARDPKGEVNTQKVERGYRFAKRRTYTGENLH